MTLDNILWRGLAMLLGGAFVAADGLNTLSQAIESKMSIDIVITVAVIIVGMTLSLPLTTWSYTNQNKVLGGLSAIVFLGCWVVSYGFSLNRMGTNKMNEAHAINQQNMQGTLAAEKLVAARKKLDEANRALAREEVTGIGPKWKEAFNLKQQAEREVAKAEIQMQPMKYTATYEATIYLVYAVPFVAQAGGVVCFLIAFGAMNGTERKKRAAINDLLDQELELSIDRRSENKILGFLKECSDLDRWHTTYRQIEKATGVNIAFVKEHLTDLHYRKAIVIEGSSKGKGTWGRILEMERC